MAVAERSASPQAIMAEVYEGGLSTREIAERAAALADSRQNSEMMLAGWAEQARDYEASLWSASRNGGGRSGRYAGLLDQFVATDDGTHHRVADVNLGIAATLASEYRKRKQRNAKGEKFWGAVAEALRIDKLDTVADLGAERLEALREKAGYRV